MVFRTDPRGEGPVLPVQGAGRHRPHPRTLALGTGPGRLCQLLCAPHSVPWKEVVHTHPRRGAALPGDEDRAASGPGGPPAEPLPSLLTCRPLTALGLDHGVYSMLAAGTQSNCPGADPAPGLAGGPFCHPCCPLPQGLLVSERPPSALGQRLQAEARRLPPRRVPGARPGPGELVAAAVRLPPLLPAAKTGARAHPHARVCGTPRHCASQTRCLYASKVRGSRGSSVSLGALCPAAFAPCPSLRRTRELSRPLQALITPAASICDRRGYHRDLLKPPMFFPLPLFLYSTSYQSAMSDGGRHVGVLDARPLLASQTTA